METVEEKGQPLFGDVRPPKPGKARRERAGHVSQRVGVGNFECDVVLWVSLVSGNFQDFLVDVRGEDGPGRSADEWRPVARAARNFQHVTDGE